ncbi:GmrSD restriction endonuclease domain-containing protein [Enhygromyxa salina]|uniref:GmrSD restriction endonucleases N-terminal domain-containing protein n=1 Tax=Enhygromyxa salina TaxID=215803 RepID=A0A2S9YNA5_9BACT|nr:DUF262 domain-containing protein [Enhygromyxa salina]PRQ06574.1 hypothetical protein ENSA7_37270 [Enhygromyxa salina]
MSQEQPPTDSIREEYFENEATGVETEEEDGGGSEKVQPWDPERIRVHTKHFSLRQVVDMIEEKDIDIAPDFQRLYVWKDRQKWSLIESILLGIPLPTFYFNEDKDGKMQVVDGVQRLTTIYDFVRGEKFALGAVDYLNDLRNSTFDQLGATFKRRMNNTQLVVHVIDPQTPYRVKFDIFRRINTGGSPLSSQEIRHCMSRERSRTLLANLAASQPFALATGGSLYKHIRMADREVVLRFCAFSMFGSDNYSAAHSLDAFLVRATEKLDDPAAFGDEELAALDAAFRRAMRNAYTVFGDHAFRKWPLDNDRRNPINRALFEVWAVVLAQYEESVVAAGAAELATAARGLMTHDQEFIEAISQGTGDMRRVRKRFDSAAEAAKAVLG